jgi:hypothetical protein
MNDANDAPVSTDIENKIKDLTEDKVVVDDKLVKRAEKLHRKTGELVDTAKEKKVVDDKLADTNAEQLDLKNKELEETSNLMVGRELKMVEQKEEIAELKKTSQGSK